MYPRIPLELVADPLGSTLREPLLQRNLGSFSEPLLNTLRTGDADLRFYVTTVEDR